MTIKSQRDTLLNLIDDITDLPLVPACFKSRFLDEYHKTDMHYYLTHSLTRYPPQNGSNKPNNTVN